MGWFDDVTSNVSGAVQSAGNAVGGAIDKTFGTNGAGNVINAGNQVAGTVTGLGIGGLPGALAGNSLTGGNILGGGSTQPQAPGLDPGLSAVQQAQLQQAQQFRSDLPTNETKAFQNLAQGVAGQTTNQLRNVNTNNSSRGLLYSGINQGQRQQVRNTAANTLSQGRSNINAGYETAANQLDASAAGTGIAIRQSQQAIQDQIYAQALQNMANQNNAFGSLLGAGGLAAGIAAA